jgi:hypothetical protein
VAEAQSVGPPDLFLAGTDGWIHLPPGPPISFYHPDALAPGYPDGLNTYVFGFRNVTNLDPTLRAGQKLKAQHSAPMFWVDQYDGANEFKLDLTNLGLGLRPDLTDAHTVHWHGFRNVIPFFDGEPTSSVAVPVNRVFRYIYRPRDPGTYMFHCHVEDVEHVHMGMTGIVFVRPALGPNYAYNDPATFFDRQFVMFLSEVWAEAHWADSHIQLPDWTDYRADFGLLNGRVYPDTLAPNGSIDPFHPERDASGDLIPPGGWGAGHDHLQYQPLSALVRCLGGEKVLLRFANLGFKEAAMTLAGIRMHVVGKDATPMVGRSSAATPFPPFPRTGVDTSYWAETVSMGAGESIDAIFTAPAYDAALPTFADEKGSYNRYVLYNRRYAMSNNLAAGGFGGQRTEVRVYGSGLEPQSIPNT